MTNLLYSSVHCSRQRENLSKLPSSCVSRRPRKERASVTKSSERISWHDRITSLRRIARRPRLSLRDATGSRRFRFDRPTAWITPHYPVLRPWEKGRRTRAFAGDVCRGILLRSGLIAKLNWVRPRRFVSASTPVLHPFCKLTVRRLTLGLPRPRPIDRHSPIRHRDVGEISVLPASRGARTLTAELHLYIVTHFVRSPLLPPGTKVERIDFRRAIALYT